MSRWERMEVAKASTAYVGVLTAEPVSYDVMIVSDPCYLKAEVILTDVTHVGTQTVALQQLLANGTWADVKTSTFTAAGTAVFLINESDTTLVPLAEKVRIALTQTDAGDEATIASIKLHRAV
jgi:hypothetical protein